jgi:Zn-dependent protease
MTTSLAPSALLATTLSDVHSGRLTVDTVLYTAYLAVALIASLAVHEFVHARTAVSLGDPTPRQSGRLTLDPRPHVDRFGTLVLPAILLLPVLFGNPLFPVFAYAKPQPLNPWNLRNRTSDSLWIALAGPGANVVLAFVFGALERLTRGQGQLGLVVHAFLIVNVIMAVMNIVPLPGLDGSKVLARFLPPRAQEVYTNLDQYLALFILLVFFILAGPIFAFVQAVGNGICSAVAGQPCI